MKIKPDRKSSTLAERPSIFVTRIYGNSVIPMCAVALESLSRVEPVAEIIVLFSDVDPRLIVGLEQAFPAITFSQVASARADEIYGRQAIADLKISAYRDFLEYVHDSQPVYFFDSDLMFRGNITLEIPADWTLLFTTQPSSLGYPVNAGLFGVRAGQQGRHFMRILERRNTRILASTRKTARANMSDGGPSQAVVRKLIGKQNLGCGDKVQIVRIRLGRFRHRILLLPRQEFNENDARRFDSSTKVLHLKSKWQELIFDPTASPGIKQRGHVKAIRSEFLQHLARVNSRARSNSALTAAFRGLLH